MDVSLPQKGNHKYYCISSPSQLVSLFLSFLLLLSFFLLIIQSQKGISVLAFAITLPEQDRLFDKSL